MTGEATSELQVRREEGSATISICREAKRNALAPEHFRRLARLLGELDADPEVRVIVLTGEGEKAFCAGADLSPERGFLRTLGSNATTGLGDVLRASLRRSKPMIARVNGSCYAGGLGLLGCCDVAVATEKASFALPEIRFGLFPFVVAAALRDRIAPVHLNALALTGRPIDAQTAMRIGLVSHVVPHHDLDRTVAELARDLMQVPSAALRAAFTFLDGTSAADRIARAESQLRDFASGQEQGREVGQG